MEIKEESAPLLHNWFCYLLILTDEKGVPIPKNPRTNTFDTYIGSTMDLRRRLRSHNGITSGGALSTSMRKKSGVWRFLLHLSGLTKIQALSLEKLMQSKGTKRRNKFVSLETRTEIKKATTIRAVQGVLESLYVEKWSKNIESVIEMKIDLTLHWWMTNQRPLITSDILPKRIKEEFVTQEKQIALLQDLPNERNHWIILPFNK